MIKTYGLTHIALAVNDVQRASQFYRDVFGVQEMYHQPGFIQVQTPGSHDIIVFEQKEKSSVHTGGIAHFGFRLQEKDDIHKIAGIIVKAGGTIKEQGEFCPGEPYIFFYDPDGYLVEVWYEQLPETGNFH